jgi:hypothetical protein
VFPPTGPRLPTLAVRAAATIPEEYLMSDLSPAELLTAALEPTVKVTRYTVTCLPGAAPDADIFAITVEPRSNGQWGVFRTGNRRLKADGTWSWGYAWSAEDGRPEPGTDEEWDNYHAGRERWLAEHRFDLETALKLAREAAPRVTVMGRTPADVLAAVGERSE